MKAELQGTGCARQSQVFEQISELDMHSSSTEGLVSNLLNRLERVLRTETPVPENKNPSEVAPNIVQLAVDIREISYRIMRTNNRLEDILDRLEV